MEASFKSSLLAGPSGENTTALLNVYTVYKTRKELMQGALFTYQFLNKEDCSRVRKCSVRHRPIVLPTDLLNCVSFATGKAKQ